MTKSLLFEPAAPEDLWIDDFGDPYCGVLKAGSYVVADPGTILNEKDYDEWTELATLSKTPFEQYGTGHDGMIRSARINGHSVTGFTVYSYAEEFADALRLCLKSSGLTILRIVFLRSLKKMLKKNITKSTTVLELTECS
jgi:hypothetical protein